MVKIDPTDSLLKKKKLLGGGASFAGLGGSNSGQLEGFEGTIDRRVATLIVAQDGTGDYASLKEAINELTSVGGVIYMKEGTYIIDGDNPVICSKDNVSIKGAGYSTKIIAESGSISMYERRNVTFEGITFLTNAYGFAFRAFGCTFCSWKNCWFIGHATTYSQGCLIMNMNSGTGTNTTKCQIIGNWFICGTASFGIYDTGGSWNIITNNYIEHAAAWAIVGWGVNHDIFCNNVCYNDCADGIGVVNGSSYCILSYNICETINTTDFAASTNMMIGHNVTW